MGKAETKVCSYCGLKNQIRNGRRKCNECLNEYNRKYHSKNREKINAQKKIYRKQNPEIVQKQRKKWKSNPQKKIVEKRYYLNNKDKITTRIRKYEIINKEKVKQWKNKGQRKATENLTDNYIIGIINLYTNISRDEIREKPLLIETYRNKLKIKRFFKNQQRNGNIKKESPGTETAAGSCNKHDRKKCSNVK